VRLHLSDLHNIAKLVEFERPDTITPFKAEQRLICKEARNVGPEVYLEETKSRETETHGLARSQIHPGLAKQSGIPGRSGPRS